MPVVLGWSPRAFTFEVVVQPYYQSPCQRITLWQGDCLKVKIPKDAIAITDPPYNIGKPQLIGKFRNRKTGAVQETIGKDFGKDFDEQAFLPSVWVPYMPDTVLCFYSAKCMHRLVRTFHRNGYEIVQDFHWCKPNAPPPMRSIGFAWGVESGYVFRKKGTKHVVNKKAGYSPNFLVTGLCTKKEREQHATQKPLLVMKWLLNFFTLSDSLVVDPFMGLGTTGVACVQMGRCFLGIEQRMDYCERAKKRLLTASKLHHDHLLPRSDGFRPYT